jgi:Ca2+:H+ antiporter
MRPVARRLLWASLALAPLTLIIDLAVHPGDTALFVLAAISLVPLAWLIGESTEHAAEHTGPRIGGLLNASFGNAPELIIALIAVADDLPNVVRGSVAGSIVSNILLVLGVALLVGVDNARLDRRSLWLQLALVFGAVLVLLVCYVATTAYALRGAGREEPTLEQPWRLSWALAGLAVATAFTAAISEVLVHSLEHFAHAAHLSEFFIAIVIVAIVGNAAEHGGAIVIARRGKMQLASEIAISSSAQVGLLVVPAVALLSFAFTHPLTLSFRPVELAAMGVASALVAFVIKDGRTRRWEGALLVGVYVVLAIVFGVSGDRGH